MPATKKPPPIRPTLKKYANKRHARLFCYAAASLISLYFGVAFVHGVIWRGSAPVGTWLLALISSLVLAALPWLWTAYLRHHHIQRTAKTPTIREQLLARAAADLAALRDNAAQYRSRADGERIGLLLEQLCNHSETYLHELGGDDDKIRANRLLLAVYLPELAHISLLYLQLPAAELGPHNRRQLLQLINDTHDLIRNGHAGIRARTLHDLETRMEVLRERFGTHDRYSRFK